MWGNYTTRWFVALDASRNKPGNDGAEASGFDADGINRKTILFFTGFPSKLENDGAGRRRPPLRRTPSFLYVLFNGWISPERRHSRHPSHRSHRL